MLLAVVVVGILLAALGSGTAQIIGVGLLSVSAVAVVCLVFLEIGYSEDRDRRRDHNRGG